MTNSSNVTCNGWWETCCHSVTKSYCSCWTLHGNRRTWWLCWSSSENATGRWGLYMCWNIQKLCMHLKLNRDGENRYRISKGVSTWHCSRLDWRPRPWSWMKFGNFKASFTLFFFRSSSPVYKMNNYVWHGGWKILDSDKNAKACTLWSGIVKCSATRIQISHSTHTL